MKKSAYGPAQVLHSVDRALQLLSLFSERRRLRVAEIVAALGVSAATASRLVAMLESHGYVQPDARARGYVVGRRLRQIGYSAIEEFDISAQVAETLEQLAADTGETAQFGVLQGSTVIFVACAEGRHQLRIGSHIGVLMPAHALSTGKALLAALAPEQLLALYPKERLTRLTSRTLTSRRKLFAGLERVRAGSFADSIGESEDDIYTIALAVTDSLGRTRGALSVAAPMSRSGERQRVRLTRALRDAAGDLSARLT